MTEMYKHLRVKRTKKLDGLLFFTAGAPVSVIRKVAAIGDSDAAGEAFLADFARTASDFVAWLPEDAPAPTVMGDGYPLDDPESLPVETLQQLFLLAVGKADAVPLP